MPHLDALALGVAFTRSGQSRFARPVAAVTAFARRWLGKPLHAPVAPRIDQDLEVRALEEQFGRATDLADLERMEREYDRRDAGGLRTWDWR